MVNTLHLIFKYSKLAWYRQTFELFETNVLIKCLSTLCKDKYNVILSIMRNKYIYRINHTMGNISLWKATIKYLPLQNFSVSPTSKSRKSLEIREFLFGKYWLKRNKSWSFFHLLHFPFEIKMFFSIFIKKIYNKDLPTVCSFVHFFYICLNIFHFFLLKILLFKMHPPIHTSY